MFHVLGNGCGRSSSSGGISGFPVTDIVASFLTSIFLILSATCRIILPSGQVISVFNLIFFPVSGKIVILQRGWAMVGRFERNGADCKLYNASVIRRWGTTEGLGELAKKGKLPDTKLDKTNGLVEFDYLTVVAMITCDEKKWEEEL